MPCEGSVVEGLEPSCSALGSLMTKSGIPDGLKMKSGLHNGARNVIPGTNCAGGPLG